MAAKINLVWSRIRFKMTAPDSKLTTGTLNQLTLTDIAWAETMDHGEDGNDDPRQSAAS